MRHEFLKDGRLKITITKEEQRGWKSIAGQIEDFDTNQTMIELFQPLIRHSGLDWISAAVTGDLTDAPMLALLGVQEPGTKGVIIGRWADEQGRVSDWARPVLQRWAFMDYQVVSPQRRLLETGVTIWDGGDVESSTKLKGLTQ